MDIELEFERLIDFAERNVYPRTFRKFVLDELKYFRDQTKTSELAAVVRVEQLKLRWQEFRLQLRGSGLLERFEKESENWQLLLEFLEGRDISNVHLLEMRRQVVRSPYAKWDVDLLFKHLLKKAQNSTSLKGLERFSVLIGLKYLLSEKEKSAHRREGKWIAPTWKFIQPILNRHAFLADFENEEMLKARLKHFIRGG